MHNRRNLTPMLLLLLTLSTNNLFAAANPGILFSEGEKALSLHDYANAANRFAEALKYSPQNIRARFRYGQALYSMSKFNESIEQFVLILQNSPNNIIARIHLVENLIKLDRRDEAQQHLSWILQIQPGHQKAMQLRDSLKNSQITTEPAPETIPQNIMPLPVRQVNHISQEIDRQVTPLADAKPQEAKKKASGNVKKTAQNRKTRGINPQPANQVSSLDPEDFLATISESFLLNLERARFSLEENNIKAAATYLATAEKLADANIDNRRLIEARILKSLVFVYSLDFRSFGKHLVQLKPMLGKQTYQSFLDIYNQGISMNDTADLARLAAGIAMGARHHSVAAALFSVARNKYPDDPLIANFLADAQISNFDYHSAEQTLTEIAAKDSQNAEANFNLARFYLTVNFQPEKAAGFANQALNLRPDDSRASVLLALIDYAKGNIDAGISRINALLPTLEDESLKAICRQIISDGQFASGQPGSSAINFAAVLALPGTPNAPIDSFRMVGEDHLRQGSFFSALKYFSKAQDLAEVGRTYLGLASALEKGGETKASVVAAAYGLEALNRELQYNPRNGRVHLYLALYHFDLGDSVNAKKAIENGLATNTDKVTRQRLTAVLNSVNNS